ncbi:MAG: hypothetical protein ABIH11_09215 [Candidatus Altiarchaeota archaeon]
MVNDLGDKIIILVFYVFIVSFIIIIYSHDKLSFDPRILFIDNLLSGVVKVFFAAISLFIILKIIRVSGIIKF